MKKLIYSACLTIAVALTSCGSFGGDKLNSKEGLSSIKTKLTEGFGADKNVSSLTLMSGEHLSSDIMTSIINYIDNGETYSQTYATTLGEGNEFLDAEKSSRQADADQKTVALKDVDFDQILVKYNEAVTLIPEEFEGFHLYDWTYSVAEGGMEANFPIEGIKKGEGTDLEGGQIVTNYYEFDFKMNASGEIEPDI